MTRLCLTQLVIVLGENQAGGETNALPVTLVPPSCHLCAVWADAQVENDEDRVGDVMISENSPEQAPPLWPGAERAGREGSPMRPGRCVVADGWQRWPAESGSSSPIPTTSALRFADDLWSRASGSTDHSLNQDLDHALEVEKQRSPPLDSAVVRPFLLSPSKPTTILWTALDVVKNRSMKQAVMVLVLHFLPHLLDETQEDGMWLEKKSSRHDNG